LRGTQIPSVPLGEKVLEDDEGVSELGYGESGLKCEVCGMDAGLQGALVVDGEGHRNVLCEAHLDEDGELKEEGLISDGWKTVKAWGYQEVKLLKDDPKAVFNYVLDRLDGYRKIEEQGIKVTVKKGEMLLQGEITVQPVLTSGSGGYRRQGGPTPDPPSDLTVEKITETLKAGNLNMDLVEIMEHPQGGVFYIKPKRYLGNVWASFGDALRSIGAEWSREDESDRKSGRWVIELEGR